MRHITAIAYMTLAFTSADLIPNRCEAQHIFNFFHADEVMATLELATLPADSTDDFIALDFTVAGDARFGFGVGPYTGDFDSFSAGLAIDVIEGELRGTTNSQPQLLDTNPALSRFNDPPSPTSTFGIDFSNIDSGVAVVYLGDESNRGRIRAGGVFTLVPEPTAACLGLYAWIFWNVIGRRGNRNVGYSHTIGRG